MNATIKLTPSESDLWNWARDAATDYWTDDEGRDDGLHFNDCPVGPAADGLAEIDTTPEVLDDMLYRLGEQLPSMAAEHGGIERTGRGDKDRMNALKDIATANRIVAKLEAIRAASERG